LCGAELFQLRLRDGTHKGLKPTTGPQPPPAMTQKEPAMNFESIRRYFRERRVYWDTLRELSTYTDRELHDIGIDRADIEHIARQAAQG
jgi:uncharacterized protein YjiS (DUF1127 family)